MSASGSRQPFAGGMEAHSWHLAAGLQARGHEVVLFASGDSDPRFAIDPVIAEHYEAYLPLGASIAARRR